MLPLSGRRVLVTRTRSQASELASALEALGAATVLIPTIEVVPPESFEALDDALTRLASFDWLVFTSANAVEAVAHRAGDRLAAGTRPPRTAAIGPATAGAARALGFAVDLVPADAVAESLAAVLIPLLQPESRILLVRAAAARDVLPEALRAAGASVTLADAYRTIVPESSSASLRRLFAEERLYPDAVTFTSSSTARNLSTLLEKSTLTLPPRIVRASIGPVTTRTMEELGIPPHVEAPEATVAGLARALARYYEARS